MIIYVFMLASIVFIPKYPNVLLISCGQDFQFEINFTIDLFKFITLNYKQKNEKYK